MEHAVMEQAFKINFQVGSPNRIELDKPSILTSITRFMALSLKYNDLLDIGYSIRDIAEFEGVDESYILRIVKMVYLSPKIQEKILLLPRSNKHRSYISAKDLLKMAEIVGFEKQERVFGRIWG
jgi:hypothetical protein